MVQKTIDRSLFDWQRGRAVGIQSRGISSLVVAQMKNSEVRFRENKGTTRCVWPTNMKTNDSRYLSRRVWEPR